MRPELPQKALLLAAPQSRLFRAGARVPEHQR